MENKTVEVKHVVIEVGTEYEQFTHTLEQLLGRYSATVAKDFDSNPKLAETELKAMEGAQGLMLFMTFEHGALLNIYGLHRKAKVFVVGNPLIAATMTRHDIRAGLYAPLRVLIYENESGTTSVEYDLPSSLFGQFHDPEIDLVARSLDSKLQNVLEAATDPSSAAAKNVTSYNRKERYEAHH